MPTASPGHIRWRWAALGLFAVLAALMAVATCRQLVGSALGPYLQLRPIAVPGLDHVVIVRAKSPESVAELATRLGIAGVDSGRAVTARPVWGRVLVDCAKSSGSVIGVDIFFRHSESEDLNAAVLEAVGEAIHSGGGRRIVLATDDFSPLSPDSRLVDPMVHGLPGIGVGLGCYSLVRLAGIGYALVIPQERNGPPRQPLAVALVASFLDSNTAAQVVIDRADNVLRFLLPSNRGRAVQLFAIRRWSMETDGPDVPEEQQIRGLGPEDYLGFCPFGVPSDDIFAPVDLDLNDLYSANGVLNVDLIRDRIVLLAAFSEDDMHEVDDRIVPGVWLHAAAIESLLAQIPAPKVSWWILVPLSAVAGLAMLLSISLARRWCRIRGIPLPLRSGGWTRPVRRPRLDVESCKHYSLWLGLGTVGLPVIVVAVGTVTGLEVHYRSAVFVAAAASGGLLGLWIVLALAWMGCVRRAWCLDRFVEPRGGFCERSATTTTI